VGQPKTEMHLFIDHRSGICSRISKEAVWIDRLLKEIGQYQTLPIPLLCDNQSAIRLAKNPEFHQRTKHIQIKYHFIREQLKNGIIDLQ
jgi:hypothetical protein